MLAIHLDPALLAIPNYANSSEEMEELVDRLTEWSMRLSKRHAIISKPEDLITILTSMNVYPAFDEIRSALDVFDLLHVYTPNDVNKLLTNLIDRSSNAVDVLGAEVVSADPCSLTPPIYVDARPQALHAPSHLACATVAFSNSGNAPRRSVVASSVFGNHPLSGIVAATVQGATISSQAKIVLPVSINQNIHLISRLNDIIGVIGSADIWERAESACDYHFAITLKAVEIKRSGGNPTFGLSNVPPFSVGSEFASSLAAYQAEKADVYAGVTLDTCARLILGIEKNELNEFVNSKGETITKDSGKTIAWRTHITKSGPGLRLMVWKSGGSFELANIGNKFDLEISNGKAAGKFTASY